MPTVTLPGGLAVPYVEHGEGRPLVLVHGALVTNAIWRDVLPGLGPGVRAIAPTLPLGAHAAPVPPGTDLSVPGVVRMIADLLAALDLHDVVLAGNDTGGALAQLVAAQHPERLGALVLVACDAYDRFPPLALWPVKALAHTPLGLRPLVPLLRLRPVQRALFALVAKKKVGAEDLDAAIGPITRDAGVARDLAALVRSAHPRHLRAALPALRTFDRPATIVWARDDLLFPARLGERLARDLPRARLEWVEDSRCFVQIDQPAELAAILRGACER